MKQSLRRPASLLVVLILQGCGEENEDATGLQCGPGTVQQGNVCVPQNNGGAGQAGGGGSAGGQAGAGGSQAGQGGTSGNAGTNSSGGTSGNAGADTGGTAGVGGSNNAGAGGNNQGGKVGDTCTPPFDLNFDKKVDPAAVVTPGRCEGTTTIICDAASQKLVAVPCGVTEECRIISLVEPFEGNVTRTTPWAVCVPAGAQGCGYKLSEEQQLWTAELAPSCEGDAAVNCTWPTLPPSQGTLTGTPDGYVKKQPCDTDEVCALEQNPARADCFVAPLTPCDSPDAKTSCQGDTLIGCYGSTYFKKISCAAQGQECGEPCYQENDTLIPGGAQCVDPMPAGASPCDPTKDPAACDGDESLRRCDVARVSGGMCGWFAVTRACAQVQCIENGLYSSNCRCAADTGQGLAGKEASCVSKSVELCDPAKTPDACDGDVARRCVNGQILTTSCSESGQACLVSQSKAGCAAKPATTCDASFQATCSGDTLEACCPASGTYGSSLLLTCAPGYTIHQPCGQLGNGLPVSVVCEQEGASPACVIKPPGT